MPLLLWLLCNCFDQRCRKWNSTTASHRNLPWLRSRILRVGILVATPAGHAALRDRGSSLPTNLVYCAKVILSILEEGGKPRLF